MMSWKRSNFCSQEIVRYKMVQLKSVNHFTKAVFAAAFPCLIFTFVWAFLVEPSLYEHNTELWSLRPTGGITKGMLQKSDMFVKIKSKIAFPLVGCLTICFKVKCLSIVETGHLLKSPTNIIIAFGCMERATSSFVVFD